MSGAPSVWASRHGWPIASERIGTTILRMKVERLLRSSSIRGLGFHPAALHDRQTAHGGSRPALRGICCCYLRRSRSGGGLAAGAQAGPACGLSRQHASRLHAQCRAETLASAVPTARGTPARAPAPRASAPPDLRRLEGHCRAPPASPPPRPASGRETERTSGRSYSTVSHVAYPHDWQVSHPPLRVRRPPHWGQPVPASGTPWVSTCPSRVPSR